MPQTERVYECAQELALTWLMEKAKELLDGFPVCYSIIAKRSNISVSPNCRNFPICNKVTDDSTCRLPPHLGRHNTRRQVRCMPHRLGRYTLHHQVRCMPHHLDRYKLHRQVRCMRHHPDLYRHHHRDLYTLRHLVRYTLRRQGQCRDRLQDLCSKGLLVLNNRCSQQMRLLTTVSGPGLIEHELFA